MWVWLQLQALVKLHQVDLVLMWFHQVWHYFILNSVLNIFHADGANTSVSNGADVVSVHEGQGIDISCTSIGVPIPTISWTFNNLAAPFTQTNSPSDLSVMVLSGGLHRVTPGSVVSTLHIVNAQYPADEGAYVCSGYNAHAGVTTTSASVVSVQVLGM